MAPSIAPPKNLLASAPRPLELLLAEDAELRIARIRGARGNDDNVYASTLCEPSNTIIVLILMMLFIMHCVLRARDFYEKRLVPRSRSPRAHHTTASKDGSAPLVGQHKFR